MNILALNHLFRYADISSGILKVVTVRMMIILVSSVKAWMELLLFGVRSLIYKRKGKGLNTEP
jgi:hypothetical protein